MDLVGALAAVLPGRFQAYSPEVRVGFPAISVGAARFALPRGELVLGNLLLADTRFPHTTEERFLGWIHPLPSGFPPPAYRFSVDPTTSTVRTLERPFLPGESFTGIIDGFLASPTTSRCCFACACPERALAITAPWARRS